MDKPTASEVYDPEGYPSCSFCGAAISGAQSASMLALHNKIDRLASAKRGTEEFEAALAELKESGFGQR